MEALCKRYEEMYPQFQHFNDPILYPAPGGPQLMDDRARITAIYLREDGLIGLAGACTWEDEHGLGVLIEDSRVVDCGYCDVAYDERWAEE
ncbi:hypothetical protein [Haloferula sp. BvORR071]|uniref:DUF6985 domain-containing protein n=1 Tax=Haloferula sp. BvORR071 TaxID=1396141 RepID=UPI00055894B8|nr:hypothetical protein [Haloferula sp. BvORR071]